MLSPDTKTLVRIIKRTIKFMLGLLQRWEEGKDV